MVFRYQTIFARVANQRSEVVDGDPVPFIDLGLGRILIVCERLVLIKDFSNTPQPIHTGTYRGDEFVIGHFRWIVNGSIPLGRSPIRRAYPTNPIGIVGGVRAAFKRLGRERFPFRLVWRVLLARRRTWVRVAGAIVSARVFAGNNTYIHQGHEEEARQSFHRGFHKNDHPFFESSVNGRSVWVAKGQGKVTSRRDEYTLVRAGMGALECGRRLSCVLRIRQAGR